MEFVVVETDVVGVGVVAVVVVGVAVWLADCDVMYSLAEYFVLDFEDFWKEKQKKNK